MPAIHLFGRRTILGGDDLQPAAFLSISLRGLQVCLLLIPIFAHIYDQSNKAGGLLHYLLYGPASSSDNCEQTSVFALLLFVYATASAVYTSGAGFLEWRISVWSSNGSPTQTEPRTTKVTHLLELKLVPYTIALLLVTVTGLAASAYASDYGRCLDRRVLVLWAAMSLLIISQLAEVLVGTFYLIHLCGQPVEVAMAPSDRESLHMSMSHNHELVEEMWADRCAHACQCLSVASCFMFGGSEVLGSGAYFGDVARALADYLETRGVLDVVPSDIVTGLVVLQRLQRQRIRQARQSVLQSVRSARSMEEGGPPQENGILLDNNEIVLPLEAAESKPSVKRDAAHPVPRSPYQFDWNGNNVEDLMRSVLSRQNQIDMKSLEEGARYARYALAIYTWVLYLYVHPVSGLPRLLWRGKCAPCNGCAEERPSSPLNSPGLSGVLETGRIDGDNLWQMHRSALLLTAGLEETNLVYAQLRSGFSENPYCILLDHRWKSVVVSIRGTFSLEDCVTDVLIDPESLERLGEEFGFDGRNQYCHGGVLTCVRNVYRDLLQHRLLDKLLLGENALYRDYTLRLVGHSLGAATCTILSYMLRPTFPTLRCLNYSPPGCSLTWDMAVGCQEWCNSFVLDADLVPRLSRDSMEHLRDEILNLIPRIKVPKIDVASYVVSGGFNRIEDILYDEDELPPSDYLDQLERFKAIQEERRQSRGAVRAIKLYPPGKMVHLVKTGEQKSCLHGMAKCLTCWSTNMGFEYAPVWVNNDDMNEIVVSPTMGTDHFPNRIRFILEMVAEDFGLAIE